MKHKSDLISTGKLFLLAGLTLLVIKVAFAGNYSWWLVFSIMFFPLWFILGIIVAIVAVAAVVCTIISPWFIYKAMKK